MKQTNVTKQIQIGSLAAEMGLNPKTIRYYEEIGLLPAPQRTSAGYRLYGMHDQERLRFIRQAKTVGLTLQEIREILSLRDDGNQPCDHVLAILDRKLARVDEHLRLLSKLRQDLSALKEAAAHAAPTTECICGIIEHQNTTHSG